MKTRCPYCGFIEDVPTEYLGETGECDNCHRDYVVSEYNDSESSTEKVKTLFSSLRSNSNIRALSNSELVNLAKFAGKYIAAHANELSLLNSCRDRLACIEGECMRRVSAAKEEGDRAEKAAHNWFLRFFFASYICAHRKPTSLELFLGELKQLLYATSSDLSDRITCLKVAVQKREITDYVSVVWHLRAIPTIDYPSIKYQQNEKPCLVMENVDGVSCSKVGEWFNGGSMVVTNKRVFYYSPTHTQVYRLQNLLEYFSDWNFHNGTLKLSSSERRSEQYQMPKVWVAAFVLAFFCDPLFRHSFLGGTEEQAKSLVLSRVKDWNLLNETQYFGTRNLLEVRKDRRLSDYGGGSAHYNTKGSVDVSEMGLLEGMVAAFAAGLQGKDVITSLDKMNGRR